MTLLIGLAIAALSQAPLPVTLPTVEGAEADATCGGRAPLTEIATCVLTTQDAVEGVMSAFEADFRRQGWNASGGSGARVVYVRRREAGGCDAFQMLAVRGDGADVPAAPTILALAAIPGDFCASSQ